MNKWSWIFVASSFLKANKSLTSAAKDKQYSVEKPSVTGHSSQCSANWWMHCQWNGCRVLKHRLIICINGGVRNDSQVVDVSRKISAVILKVDRIRQTLKPFEKELKKTKKQNSLRSDQRKASIKTEQNFTQTWQKTSISSSSCPTLVWYASDVKCN